MEEFQIIIQMAGDLEYIEKSGNFKRSLENQELSGNFILIDRSQGNLKMFKLYIFARNAVSFQSPVKWKNLNY